MLPRYHVISGLLLGFLFYLAGASLVNSAIVFGASFLLDVDHYARYIVKEKNFNLKKSLKWHSKNMTKKGMKYPLLIFHGIEFAALLIILSFFYKIFLFVLAGFLLHMVLDTYDVFLRKIPDSKISQIYVLYRNRKIK